ncbi:MAG: M15 family metallopeptidase [Brevundimonas mediterranea]|uniref:M15 family metallopeptidase n=1 Tax=Brevundimonas mediterranea TaxID=74329 RepID=UPI004033F4B3
MAYTLSKRSTDALIGVEPRLVRVVKRAISITTQDFLVTEGVRTPERQRQLYAQGRTAPGKKVTWTLKSNHFVQASGYGHAVDLSPFPVDWNDLRKFHLIADAMKRAALMEGVKMEWGGDWQTKDLPHYQLG